MDNDTDREALTSIVEYLFSPKAYHKDFLLNPGAVDGDGVSRLHVERYEDIKPPPLMSRCCFVYQMLVNERTS